MFNTHDLQILLTGMATDPKEHMAWNLRGKGNQAENHYNQAEKIRTQDTSARESARTIAELEVKTEEMLDRLFIAMRRSCQAVNAGKTQILCLATSQRRRRLKERGEHGKMTINLENKLLTEENKGKVLEVTWSSGHGQHKSRR